MAPAAPAVVDLTDEEALHRAIAASLAEDKDHIVVLDSDEDDAPGGGDADGGGQAQSVQSNSPRAASPAVRRARRAEPASTALPVATARSVAETHPEPAANDPDSTGVQIQLPGMWVPLCAC